MAVKIKQKKLESEYFAHLTERELQGKDSLLAAIPTVDGDVANLQDEIHKLFHLATFEGGTDFRLGQTGWAFEQMKHLIEIAYVMLAQSGLAPDPHPFSGDMSSFFEEDNHFYVSEIPVGSFLKTFFGFKTIGQWNGLLDTLMASALSKVPINDTTDQKDIIQTRFLLIKLPVVMQEVCKKGGIPEDLPLPVV